MVTKTASTVVPHAGEHLFKVVGHSLLKGRDTYLTSGTFHIGGHDWAILYFPNGTFRNADDHFSSIFLKPINTGDAEQVVASYSFCLQHPALPSPTAEKHRFSYTNTKFALGGWGRDKFVNKADLAASGCLEDDYLLIKCTVTVIAPKILLGDDCEDSIIVPPSVISKDLGRLLKNGLEADLTVKIGRSKSFKVHGCMLAARSPVFRALLCGSMVESRQTSIRVNDLVDARVFEALLYYMYNDRLPELMEETTQEAINMTQQLLIAADRYAMERLKLICEAKLSRELEVNTLGFTLNLADQFHCAQLKNSCLNYIARDTNRIRASIQANKFKRLKKIHPGIIAYDILDKAIEKL